MYSLPARPAFARSDSQAASPSLLPTYFCNSAKIGPCMGHPSLVVGARHFITKRVRPAPRFLQSWLRLQLEVGVLDDADHVPEGIDDAGDHDPAADILCGAMLGGAELEQPRIGGRGAGNTPVRDWRIPSRDLRDVRIEAELEAAHA